MYTLGNTLPVISVSIFIGWAGRFRNQLPHQDIVHRCHITIRRYDDY